MKKKFLFLGGIVLFIFLSIFVFRIISPEDDWVCDKDQGVWIQHGTPDYPAPAAECQKEFKEK